MSKFYGQVFGASSTSGSRRGHSDITVSAQSWDGSLITRLYYNNNDLMIDLSYNDGSSSYGRTIFNGQMSEFLQVLESGKNCLNGKILLTVGEY